MGIVTDAETTRWGVQFRKFNGGNVGWFTMDYVDLPEPPVTGQLIDVQRDQVKVLTVAARGRTFRAMLVDRQAQS